MEPPPDLADEFHNWLELPRDVTASILQRLGVIEILTSAQMVCSLWRNLCKDPSMWRTVHICNPHTHWKIRDVETMCRLAVNRSCGQLVDLYMEYLGTDNLLRHIANSSSQLKRLRLVSCYNYISDEGLSKAAAKLPLLEELYISSCSFSKETLKAVGRCCPHLKSLEYNRQGYGIPHMYDEVALAIAENMPELRHLQLFGDGLTNDGLQAILDGCPHLESLDLRKCFNVSLGGNLGRRCAEQIKDLWRPHDPADDSSDDDDYGCSDDDYPTGGSDYDD